MKRFFYIFPILCVLLFSCKDDLTVNPDIIDDSEGSSALSISIDIPDNRTRAIDMTPGAGVYLNKVWVGIYRQSDGKRVGGTGLNDDNQTDLSNRLTSSGSKIQNVIPVQGYENTVSTAQDLIVVGIANYDEDIKAYYYEDEDKTGRKNGELFEALKKATTWNLFKEIAIDAENSVFKDQTPMLMGYLYKDSDSDDNDGYIYTKVNQFAADNSGQINLYPFGFDSNYKTNDIYVNANSLKDGYLQSLNSQGYILKLRRMRSKMNIIINTKDGVSITNAQYKVFNKPNSAFLAQRRTNTFASDYGVSNPEDVKYSSNSADIYEGEGYSNDENWNAVTDNYNFSFEHFENKHWARYTQDLKEYHDREKNTANGVFSVLAQSSDDWNNNASYFVLKLNIRDTNTGRNGEVEYTIHEGFCNDKDGVQYQRNSNGTVIKDSNGNPQLLGLSDRLKDFSCVRNTDYYYNIQINGVQDIYLTVTQNNNNHPNDQHNGNIWQMLYPKFNNTDDSRISTANDATFTLTDAINCTIDEDGNTMDFEDIAFRLVGSFYDESKQEKVPVDLCYNLAHGELDGFSGLWIDPVNGVTEYFVDTKTTGSQGEETVTTALDAMENYFASSHPEEEEMLKRFTVNADGNGNSNLNIVEFIQKLKLKTDDKVTKITGVNVKGIKLYETEEESDGPRNHMIGLYIFDRKRSIEGGNRVKTDNIDCYYYQIRAIEQYPAYLSNATYEKIFAQYNNATRIPSGGGTTQQINNNHNDINGGQNMIFSENPDIAFRLIGYYDKDGSKEYSGFYDLCYNFDMNEYPYFNKDMPDVSYNTRSISKTALSRENIPDDLLNGIKIQEGEYGQTYTIKEFVSRVLAGNITSNTDYRFVFSEYKKLYYKENEEERNNSIRGIYIFDKKDRYKQPVLYDPNTNSATYQIYAAEQDASYDPPKPLPNPSGYINYNQTATYNIIEEYLGTITVPLLSGYTYGQDYNYKLFTQDDSGNSRRECTLEKIKSTNNDGTLTFYVPMSIAHASARSMYIYSASLNDRLLTSTQADNVGKTTALTNPEWDFTDSNWNTIYRSKYFEDRDSKFRKFTDKEVEFSGGYNVPPITLSAPGSNEIRGSIQENDGFLYINNSGAKVIINIYRKCKISLITVGPNGSADERGIKVTAGDFTTSLMYTNSKIDYKDVVIPNDEGEHLELSFTITGNSGNIYYIKLTD